MHITYTFQYQENFAMWFPDPVCTNLFFKVCQAGKPWRAALVERVRLKIRSNQKTSVQSVLKVLLTTCFLSLVFHNLCISHCLCIKTSTKFLVCIYYHAADFATAEWQIGFPNLVVLCICPVLCNWTNIYEKQKHTPEFPCYCSFKLPKRPSFFPWIGETKVKSKLEQEWKLLISLLQNFQMQIWP